MNEMAPIGHNNPPDPIDEALAPFGDLITEAEGWLDGQEVTTEGQMKAVDALIKGMKAARKAVDDARDVSTKPLHEAWKTEVARWKPTQDDLDLQVKGLVALVDGFKRKLAAEKEAARQAAWADAEAKRKEAEAKIAQASASDIDAQRDARAAMEAADLARAQASVAQKDTVKGMRTVTRWAFDGDDEGAAISRAHRDIAMNDRAAIVAFVTEYITKHHKARPIDGVKVWQDKEAY